MHAGFVFQNIVSAAALDLNRCTFNAPLFSQRLMENNKRPSLFLGILMIHLKQHRSPILGINPASAGINAEQSFIFHIIRHSYVIIHFLWTSSKYYGLILPKSDL